MTTLAGHSMREHVRGKSRENRSIDLCLCHAKIRLGLVGLVLSKPSSGMAMTKILRPDFVARIRNIPKRESVMLRLKQPQLTPWGELLITKLIKDMSFTGHKRGIQLSIECQLQCTNRIPLLCTVRHVFFKIVPILPLYQILL